MVSPSTTSVTVTVAPNLSRSCCSGLGAEPVSSFLAVSGSRLGSGSGSAFASACSASSSFALASSGEAVVLGSATGSDSAFSAGSLEADCS